jgi:predicted MFS family arabinose efflux permease
MQRRVLVLIFTALFVSELSWSGLTPLVPDYIALYHLSDFEGGLIFSVAGIGILAVSLPASFITQRVSPRTLSLWGIAVVAATSFAMPFVPGYWALIFVRLVFGIAFGTLWVSLIAWLDQAAGNESPRVLALTTTTVAVAATLSPAYTGWVAEQFSLGTPFVVLGAIMTVVLIVLLMERSRTGLRKDAAPPARDLFRVATSDPGLATMLLLTIGAAVLWMTADLLVPLRLDDAGFNAAKIGLVFSLSALMFAGSSAVAARQANHWTRPRFAAFWALATGVATAIAMVFTGVPATITFLVTAGVATGITIALTFPFGLLAVGRGVVSVAVMSAMANIIWALSGIAGPTVGGAFAGWAGDQVAFGLLALVSVVVAGLVLWVNRKEPQPQVALDG